MGVTDDGVFCAVENSNDVTVFHDFSTVDAARAFVGSARLREAMSEAGVVGDPEIWVTEQA